MKKSYDAVIVNYNGERIIAECLKSLLKSDLRPAKIIVFDNGSKDNSVKVIKNIRRSVWRWENSRVSPSRSTRQAPEVILIESEKNIGFGPANNEATKRAQAPFILFLNNDIILDKKCSTELLGWFKDNTTAILNPIIYKGWKIENNQLVYAFGAVLDRFGFNYGLYSLDGADDLNCFSGACFMARTDIFKKFRFEKSFFLYFEEPEMSIRLLKAGYKIARVKKAKSYHLVSQSSPKEVEGVAFRQFYAGQNRWFMIGKHFPVRLIFGAISVNLLHLFYLVFFFTKNKKFKYLKLFYLAWYHFSRGLLGRSRVGIKKKLWHKKLTKPEIRNYFALKKKVFSKKV